MKAFADVRAPVVAKFAVFGSQPALRARADQVRWIEGNQVEAVVWKGEIPEVEDHVRTDFQAALAVLLAVGSVGDKMKLVPLVAEKNGGVFLVEPPHAGAAAWVKDGRQRGPVFLGFIAHFGSSFFGWIVVVV